MPCEVRPALPLWPDPGTGIYLAPGPLAPTARAATSAVYFLSLAGHEQDAAGIRLQATHSLMLDVQPGRHLQEVVARRWSCSLRQVFAADTAVWGWAERAVALCHGPGGVHEGQGGLDAYERALTRSWVAFLAAYDVLLHTRTATAEELSELLALWQGTEAGLDEVGRLGLSPGVDAASFAGARALDRLAQDVARERGDAFDLAEFHAAVLRAGPAPPALLREELTRD